MVSRTEIQIDGVGRLAVQPGGADILALTAQRDDISAELTGFAAATGGCQPASPVCRWCAVWKRSPKTRVHIRQAIASSATFATGGNSAFDIASFAFVLQTEPMQLVEISPTSH